MHFYEISILEVKLPLVRMEVTCSKGTYIRTLCHDIGEKLGCHGCMEQLIRTRVGQFDRNGAHTLDEIAAIVGEGRLSEILVPVDEMFAALRSFATADDHAKKLAENGNPLKPAQIREIGETASGGDFAEDEEFRLYLDDGTFVGIYQYRPSQNLTRPVKLFLERTMRYLTKTLDFDSRGDSVVTLGKFDGLHRGHMLLIPPCPCNRQNGRTGNGCVYV